MTDTSAIILRYLVYIRVKVDRIAADLETMKPEPHTIGKDAYQVKFEADLDEFERQHPEFFP